MSFVVRNRPYPDKYFSISDNKQQQLCDTIISELQDTNYVNDRYIHWKLGELSPVIEALNASVLFNRFYVASYSSSLVDSDLCGYCYLIRFTRA